ncbi:MAG TPA: ribosome silencing factor [Longimicrobiales bacterium]|nr:ribosome silencing factor [Longimicrobiales bacterium]
MPAHEEDRALKESDLTEEVSRTVDLARDRKARDLAVLDLRSVSSATDFFVVCSGTSDIHVRSIAEHIIDELKKEGHRPDHVEGLRGGRWVLVDYIDFVIHVFHPAAREFYQLERLWGDAPTLTLES